MRLSEMLGTLGMQFEGRPHSGMDDTRNIARIAMRMLTDDAILNVNERIHSSKLNSCKRAAATSSLPAASDYDSDCEVKAVACDEEEVASSSDSDVTSTDQLKRTCVSDKTQDNDGVDDITDLLQYYSLRKT